MGRKRKRTSKPRRNLVEYLDAFAGLVKKDTQKIKPCKVRIIKRDGYSVGVTDRPISMKQIKAALADFP